MTPEQEIDQLQQVEKLLLTDLNWYRTLTEDVNVGRTNAEVIAGLEQSIAEMDAKRVGLVESLLESKKSRELPNIPDGTLGNISDEGRYKHVILLAAAIITGLFVTM